MPQSILNLGDRWTRLDWRIKAILNPLIWASILSIIIWVAGYYAEWLKCVHEPASFPGAVFAAWIGGLILYAVIGSIVAYVSLPRPEKESFDTRARILFRQQSGKHIDYIIQRFQTLLEHFTEKIVINVVLIDYDESSQRIRDSCETTTNVRAYIDDIASTFVSQIDINDITGAPQGKDPNKIVFLRLNGVPQPECSCEFDNAIQKPYHVTIEPKGMCEIVRCSQVWFSATSEENTYAPARYTQDAVLIFENRLPNRRSVIIQLSKDGGKNWDDTELKSGETKIVFSCKDALPQKEIYRYKVAVH